MGQITATRNLVATKVVRHAGQQASATTDENGQSPIRTIKNGQNGWWKVTHLLANIHFPLDLVKVILKEILFPLMTRQIIQMDALFPTARPTFHWQWCHEIIGWKKERPKIIKLSQLNIIHISYKAPLTGEWAIPSFNGVCWQLK